MRGFCVYVCCCVVFMFVVDMSGLLCGCYMVFIVRFVFVVFGCYVFTMRLIFGGYGNSTLFL